MGNEAKLWQNSEVPKLPLLAIAATMESSSSSSSSPNHSGMQTPPIHSTVSIPFLWEEKPGKPRFSFTTTTPIQRRCLELPPRLLLQLMDPQIPKQKGGFHLHKQCFCGSFRFEKRQLGAMVLRKRGVLIEKEWFCWLGKKWSFGSKREVDVVFADTHKDGSFSSCLLQPNTQFWGSIGEGLKQINIPWKSRKSIGKSTGNHQNVYV